MGYMHDLGDVKPDIVTLGKAISGGVTPVSGILADDHIMMTIKPGDHGSTYGGNPLGMAVAKAAVEALVEEGMVENAQVMGQLLHDNLNSMSSPLIKEVRARGLFCGMEFHEHLAVDGNHFAKILLKNGLVTKATHVRTVRFAPALIIKEHEINEACEIVSNSLRELEQMNEQKS